MSFQAYLDNVHAKTGLSPDDFARLAQARGLVEDGRVKPGVKAGQITDWLKSEHGLGHGHAMSVYAWLNGKRA